MAQRVAYPAHIEPLVQFVEETTPDRIVAATHDKLAAGTSVKEMLLASALAVVRSSDLPPGHHGGPLHPLAGLHAVRHIAARLPGEYAMLPVIQNVAVANKHIHSPAMGPFILAEAKPVSEKDSVEATLAAFRVAVGRGVYNACDHYFLYLLERLSPMQVLEHLLQVAIPKNQLDDHYFLFPVFTWRALEYLGWEYARFIGRAPVRYITRPSDPTSLEEVDRLIDKHGLLERELRVKTGDDETAAVTALANEIGRCSKFTEVPEMVAQALGDGLSLEGVGEGLSVGGSTLFLRSQAPTRGATCCGSPSCRSVPSCRPCSCGTRGRKCAWPSACWRRISSPSRSAWPRCPSAPRTSSSARSQGSSAACPWASACPRPVSRPGGRPTR